MKITHPSAFASALLGALILVSGCTTRSISNSGYREEPAPGHSRPANTELSEFEILGVNLNDAPTENDIAAALASTRAATLKSTSKVVLIQSGADYPDSPMLESLRKHFAVEGLSGVPPRNPDQGKSYARTLRLIAAKGGFDKIVCYWGVLESERDGFGTVKTMSWIPVVGDVLPDEREKMRIRLKAVVIDVASGNWTFVTPQAISASQISTAYSRKRTDQGLVEQLKTQGYEALTARLAADA
jgi:hypothetical protein